MRGGESSQEAFALSQMEVRPSLGSDGGPGPYASELTACEDYGVLLLKHPEVLPASKCGCPPELEPCRQGLDSPLSAGVSLAHWTPLCSRERLSRSSQHLPTRHWARGGEPLIGQPGSRAPAPRRDAVRPPHVTPTERTGAPGRIPGFCSEEPTTHWGGEDQASSLAAWLGHPPGPCSDPGPRRSGEGHWRGQERSSLVGRESWAVASLRHLLRM